MTISNVINHNNSQLIELPLEAHFPDGITEVTVRVNGTDRILSPVAKSWDSFFKQGPVVTDDFMAE
ncbi:type II toxin-antitoxin system VapB family antitoxin [Rheinheimera hassiensis]|uniref:type II toxin-antitoxin system VapB family antitoxin n=1 Tax=Rheinheimera hassiensis TaxID=1193627 RepID=UPI001F062A14|nr:type II toxin-antitoxin system VapB family antitoxin [Rheinheimera hassiensis]